MELDKVLQLIRDIADPAVGASNMESERIRLSRVSPKFLSTSEWREIAPERRINYSKSVR
jgi:hypothetical protein